MVGVDIADRFTAHAMATKAADPRRVEYRVASAIALPFPDAQVVAYFLLIRVRKAQATS